MNHDFPDPSIIRARDGFYYAYATQGYSEDANPKLFNIQIARSQDLKTWQHLGDALPTKPEWSKNTQSFWAPDIHFSKNLYYLYYSAEPNTADGLCLAVAVSRLPTGPFIDSGKPLNCGPSFSNIDPMIYENFLYWGSGFDPVRVRKLDASLTKFDPSSKTLPLIAPDRGPNPAPYTKLLEGAWILKRDGFFYLFVSGEDCCGLPSPKYAVLVLRSKSALGPFEWRNGDPRQSIVIEGSGNFTGTGHNAFIHDPAGNLWTYYHGIDVRTPLLANPIPGDRTVRRVLLRSKVDFVNGWPVI